MISQRETMKGRKKFYILVPVAGFFPFFEQRDLTPDSKNCVRPFTLTS